MAKQSVTRSTTVPYWIIGSTIAAAAAGAALTAPTINGWYAGVPKPSFTPPGSLFGPVWTVLYILMALSAILIWKKAKPAKLAQALTPYYLQLGLNFLWSYLFFNLHQPWWAFADIVLLWLAIAWTISRFRKFSGQAAALLYPYLTWVTFATALNFAIAQLIS